MDWRDQQITEQEIILKNGEEGCLGPNLILQNCRVISYVSAYNLLTPKLRMNGGTFEQKSKLKNYQFSSAHFDGTIFLGHYIGCDFGDWEPGKASFQNCDLSKAKLDNCRLILCPLDTIKLPKWPCFIISSPSNAHAYVTSHTWPENLGRILKLEESPKCVATVTDAAKYAKEDGISVEQVRDLIKGIPGLIIID